ncbi:MAG TPA: aldo/keto reductase [Tepidisphaeraceae bacterium]|jgi:aryl-alcohol dehydrogenase-like predicted oxidoreductase|nr:aldo/keto reductase [Tepidisphaeraceae bacterium]
MFPTRPLGLNGPQVSSIGLGCMGMSEFYGPHSDTESFSTLQRSLDLGITFWDTADAYGNGSNEQLIGEFLKRAGLSSARPRENVFLCTKFANLRSPDGKWLGVSGKPDYVPQACDASLKRLGLDHIDLYYQHRVDPQTPIEDTVGAMSKLVKQGKVRHLGLSEASADSIRRAHKIHPISALQTEYSLWTRDPESEILPTCRELGIAFVAYSPLGRGFLTGQIKSPSDLAPDDWRHNNPRFQGENFQKNLDLVSRIEQLAKAKSILPSQLALAWLLAQGNDIIPIPGTKRPKYLEQNAASAQIHLTPADLAAINSALPPNSASGTRYPEPGMRAVNR